MYIKSFLSKSFLSALLPALLLCVPFSTAEGMEGDRAEQYTQPPQSIEERQDPRTYDLVTLRGVPRPMAHGRG